MDDGWKRRRDKLQAYAEAARRLEDAAEDVASELDRERRTPFLVAALEALERLPNPETFALRHSPNPRAVPRPIGIGLKHYEDAVLASLLSSPLRR